MWNQKPCFRFEIDNLSKKKAAIKSKVFVSGGCEWYLNLHPKGDGRCDNHVSLYLYVAKPKSLGRGWERSAKFYFVLLNQSDKELYKSPIGKKRSVFCAKDPAWGFPKTLPLSKFPEKGFLDKDRLIIEVYIKVFKAFDGVGVVSETNKTMDIHGFQVLASQVTPVRKIFAEHPDLAEDFKPKNQVVKTVYMNVLLNLIEMLHKPSLKHSETELRNADSELSELMEVGFKLDWLKSKLDEVSLRKRDGSCLQQVSKNMEQRKLDYKAYVASFFLDMKKTDDADGSRVQQLEERVEDVSLERKKTDDSARLQQLEERLKNLEKMELGFKLDCFKSKLEEVSLERKTSRDADGSRVQQLDERLKNLELMELGFNLSCIKSKLEEVSLKRNKSGDADGSLAKQLEERLKNLELLVLDLKFELDKEKAKSCDDEFLLVDEVA